MKFRRVFQVFTVLLFISVIFIPFAAADDEISALPADFSYINSDGHLFLDIKDGQSVDLNIAEEIIDYTWFPDGTRILLLIRLENEVSLSSINISSEAKTDYEIHNLDINDYFHLGLGSMTDDNLKIAVTYGNCIGILNLEIGDMQEISCFEPIADPTGDPVTSGITYLNPVFSAANDELIVTASTDVTAQITLFPLIGEVPESETLGCCFYPQISRDGLDLYAYATRELAPETFMEFVDFDQGIARISIIDLSVQDLIETAPLSSMQALPDTQSMLLETLNTGSGQSEIHLLDLESHETLFLAEGTNPKWRPGSNHPVIETPDIEVPEPIAIDADLDSLLEEHQTYVEELSSVTYVSAGDQTSAGFGFLNPEFHQPFRQNLMNSNLDENEKVEALLRLTLQDQLNKAILDDYSRINAYAVEVELTIGNLLSELSRINQDLYGEGTRLNSFSDQMISSFTGQWSSTVSNIELRLALEQGLFSTFILSDQAETRYSIAKSNFNALLNLMEQSYLESYERILDSGSGHVFSGSLEEMYSRFTETQFLISETIYSAEQGGIGTINLTKIKELTTLLNHIDLEDQSAAFQKLSEIMLELRLVLSSVSHENIQGEALDCLARITAHASGQIFSPDVTKAITCTALSETNWVDSASWNLLRPWWKEKMEDYILVIGATSKEITSDGSTFQIALMLNQAKLSGFSGKVLEQEEVRDPLAELNQIQSDLDTATHMAFLLLTPPDGYLPSSDSAYLLERIFFHDHLAMEYNLGVQAYLSAPELKDKAVQNQIKDLADSIETNLLEIIDFVEAVDFSNETDLTGPHIFEFPDDLSGTTEFSVPVDFVIRNIGSEPIHNGWLSIYAGEIKLAEKQFDQVLYGQEIEVNVSIILPSPEYEHLTVIFQDSARYDLARLPVDIREPILSDEWVDIMDSVCPGVFLTLGGIFALSIIGLLIVGALSLISRRGSAPADPQN